MDSRAEHVDQRWLTWAPQAKPLFKWAGGKQRFLWDNRHRLPESFNTYHEPFAGGLSVFFHLAATSAVPINAVVADVNLRIVRTYEEVKWEPEGVSDRLMQLETAFNAATDKVSFYNDVRAQHNRKFPTSDAARFIFLMNTCWNGVFRINQSGHFNVPIGQLKGELKLPSPDHIYAVSTVLQHARIRAQSWESGLTAISPGDFVFFDPPYFHSDGRRDLYEKNKFFGARDQAKLADALVELQNRDVEFVLTNSAYEIMINLYRERGLAVEVISAHRSISSKLATRGKEDELVVTPGNGSANTMLRSAQLKLLLRDA